MVPNHMAGNMALMVSGAKKRRKIVKKCKEKRRGGKTG
jgi:hypothetical protein